ncbi:beta-amyrin 11-oxidase [Cajanus cajan]|uniref:beta-amyrin 11-oxidase n=1 Tax=Cajanus cajan TaxID=3821 RepID=UPI00098DCFAF|nr:beta-amyrin 11-oxidase [Cajanus cajan]
MELHWVWMSVATLLASYVLLNKFVRRLNGWYYDLKLGNKQSLLPPGDMGWPLIGNMIPFIKVLSSGQLDSFINNFVSKYGRSGIYKTHLFGKPSMIVCAPEMCRQVLNDDENFKLAYPKSVSELLGSNTSTGVFNVEHKRLRRVVSVPIMGQNMLAMYLARIEEIVIDSLEELSSIKHPVEIFKELEKITFKVITYVFFGSHNQPIVAKVKDLFREFSDCNPLFSVPINLPGFTYHKALQVRKKLLKVVISGVGERRLMRKKGQLNDEKDFIDILLEDKRENGEELEDEQIADIVIGLLFVGHESTATGLMWSLMYLTLHPDVFRKAKQEQEEIVKARPPSQKHLSHSEVKQMVYLSQVINEVLRLTNISFAIFREATADVNVKGYIIQKGWKVLVWLRAIHMNPEYYPNPKEFNPSRWDNYNATAGTFLPFGGGSRLCPGKDISNLETTIFLHYFLLNYRLEIMNSKSHVPNFSFSYPKDLAKVIKVSS